MKDKIRGTGLMKKLMAKFRAIETRLIIFYLLRDRKLLSLASKANYSHKLDRLNKVVDSNTIVLDNANSVVKSANTEHYLEEQPRPRRDYAPLELDDEYDYHVNEEEEERNDQHYGPLELDDEYDDHVNDVEEERNENERVDERKLEDDIDRKADLFIRQFHHQMRLQRLNSG